MFPGPFTFPSLESVVTNQYWSFPPALLQRATVFCDLVNLPSELWPPASCWRAASCLCHEPVSLLYNPDFLA